MKKISVLLLLVLILASFGILLSACQEKSTEQPPVSQPTDSETADPTVPTDPTVPSDPTVPVDPTPENPIEPDDPTPDNPTPDDPTPDDPTPVDPPVMSTETPTIHITTENYRGG